MCGPRRQADPGGGSHNKNHINYFNLFTFLHLALISLYEFIWITCSYTQREKRSKCFPMRNSKQNFSPTTQNSIKTSKITLQPLKSHITVRNQIFKLIRGKMIILR